MSRVIKIRVCKVCKRMIDTVFGVDRCGCNRA
jgi:hypothetical protein